MPYVTRIGGVVRNVWGTPQPDATEFLADDDPEVLAITQPKTQPAAIAEAARIDAIRANPDCIDLLTRLSTNTEVQLNTWIDNNITLTGNTVPLLRAEVQAILRKFAKQVVKGLLLRN